jgi:membrane protease YdiL (CAAX protease family)
VALQTSYHFYQGTFAAIAYIPVFLVFAVYYQRTQRVLPVLLAHMVWDIAATLAAH